MVIGLAAGGLVALAVCIAIVYVLARRRDEAQSEEDPALTEELSVTDPTYTGGSQDILYITQEAALDDDLLPAEGAFTETAAPASQVFGQSTDESKRLF
jgi:hypothetical protein